METLFGHLSTRFASSPENLATEALAWLLARSRSARDALNAICAALDAGLPEIRSFRTQVSGGDAGIPDLVGFDASGRAVMLVENKFWAGLTPNQPAGYLAQLPPHSPALLLFVVPEKRLGTFWLELIASASRADIALGAPATTFQHLLQTRVGPHVLAATSWRSLLSAIESALAAAGDNAAISDLVQLRGLCNHMDTAGFVPASVAELTNLETPRRLIGLADLAMELSEQAIQAGLADVRGLRPTHGLYKAGRYIRIGSAGAWLGMHHEYWARFGISPLWLEFPRSEFGRAPLVMEAVAGWMSAIPAKAFEADGAAVVPLRIAPHATKDAVLEGLMAQLRELHTLLQLLPAGPPAPEPV